MKSIQSECVDDLIFLLLLCWSSVQYVIECFSKYMDILNLPSPPNISRLYVRRVLSFRIFKTSYLNVTSDFLFRHIILIENQNSSKQNRLRFDRSFVVFKWSSFIAYTYLIDRWDGIFNISSPPPSWHNYYECVAFFKVKFVAFERNIIIVNSFFLDL